MKIYKFYYELPQSCTVWRRAGLREYPDCQPQKLVLANVGWRNSLVGSGLEWKENPDIRFRNVDRVSWNRESTAKGIMVVRIMIFWLFKTLSTPHPHFQSFLAPQLGWNLSNSFAFLLSMNSNSWDHKFHWLTWAMAIPLRWMLRSEGYLFLKENWGSVTPKKDKWV